ncbi:MAG: hypothetical protein A2X94_14530 [Bdellovibrionales bacterium GWB1_55_8]|nr:MAG: hypothetical protein A2X94_14530 [Bdellovibrionales bacterium GWB1_55_8]
MPYDQGGKCWSCGNELTALDYGREDTCRKCGRDTKTCKGCRFFDPGTHNECHESQADRVLDKERSNFCDYFKPSSGAGGQATSRDAMRSAAEALFKKK